MGEKGPTNNGVWAAAARKTFRGWDRTQAHEPRGEEGARLSQSERRIRAPSVALATGREACARLGSGLGPALGDRTMSRPKVGVPRDPDVFIVLREGREATEASDLGVPAEWFWIEWEENDEYREKTSSPGWPRASGGAARVHHQACWRERGKSGILNCNQRFL